MPGNSRILDSKGVIASISSYRAEFNKTNPSLFAYLSESQKKLVHEQLITTLFLIRLEAEEHLVRGRFTAMNNCIAELEYCGALLEKLKLASDITLAGQARQEGNPANTLKYTGLLIRLDLNESLTRDKPFNEEEFIKEVETFTKSVRKIQQADNPKPHMKYSKTSITEVDQIKQWIGKFNDVRRLWWVWGAMTTGAIFDLMADPTINITLPNQDNMNNILGSLSPTLGASSWIIYLFRGILDMGEAIREAFTKFNPEKFGIISKVQLNKEETSWKRLSNQASNRKFMLWNDFLWGIANTVCFFYLNGSFKTKLGAGGYILSLALLVGDVLLTSWRFIEQHNQHYAYIEKLKAKNNELMLAYHLEVESISQESANKQSVRKDAFDKRYLSLHSEQFEKHGKIVINGKNIPPNTRFLSEYKQNQQAIAKANFDWLYQRRKLTAELSYTITLVLSFACVCGFFATGGLSLLIMGVVGTSLLFLSSIVFNITNAIIDRQKLQKSSENHLADSREFYKRLKEIPADDDTQKRLCFLQMQSSVARSDFDRHMAKYQLNCLPINTLIDALMPVVFFLSFNFLSFGVGVVVIATCILIILAAKRLMKSWEPKEADYKDRFFPKFEGNDKLERDYNAFKNLPRETQGNRHANGDASLGGNEIIPLLPFRGKK